VYALMTLKVRPSPMSLEQRMLTNRDRGLEPIGARWLVETTHEERSIAEVARARTVYRVRSSVTRSAAVPTGREPAPTREQGPAGVFVRANQKKTTRPTSYLAVGTDDDAATRARVHETDSALSTAHRKLFVVISVDTPHTLR
jgi:hypothetical protein